MSAQGVNTWGAGGELGVSAGTSLLQILGFSSPDSSTAEMQFAFPLLSGCEVHLGMLCGWLDGFQETKVPG